MQPEYLRSAIDLYVRDADAASAAKIMGIYERKLDQPALCLNPPWAKKAEICERRHRSFKITGSQARAGHRIE